MHGPLAPDDEQEWLRRAQALRDPAAFRKLVERHHGRVRAVLLRLTHGNRALADELAQEALWKAWNALPAFRADARFGTWLHRIAYHEFLQAERRTVPARGRDDAWRIEATPEPASDADNDSLRIDLQRALDALKPAERAAILYCYHGELSHAEAAQVLGMPLGTVKSLVLRGAEKLRHSLAAWQPPRVTKEQDHG